VNVWDRGIGGVAVVERAHGRRLGLLRDPHDLGPCGFAVANSSAKVEHLDAEMVMSRLLRSAGK
jgi:hypothetical protein